MGPGGPGVAEDRLEHLLLQHGVHPPGGGLHRQAGVNTFSENCCTALYTCNVQVYRTGLGNILTPGHRERLSITKEELHKMLQSDELSRASVLVFANKQVMILASHWCGAVSIFILFADIDWQKNASVCNLKTFVMVYQS